MKDFIESEKDFRMSGREGVRLYKALHRTVQRVFRGDRAAMFAARDKVLHGFPVSTCDNKKIVVQPARS